MINKYLITIIVSAIFSVFGVQAQIQNLDLVSSDKSILNTPCRPSGDTAAMASLPFKGYPHRSLRKMAYNCLQATYENIPDNPVRRKLFKEFVERYKYDTTYLTKTRITQNYIYVCTALDEKGMKHVMVDANNNHDFSDDKDYIFDPNETAKHLKPVINANIGYFDGQAVRQASVLLQIDAFETFFPDSYYKSDMEKKLDVTMGVLLQNKSGTVTIGDRPFKINISNYDSLYPKSPFKVNIQKLPFNEKNNNDYTYDSRDTIDIAGGRYKVVSLKGNKLTINPVGGTGSYGAETGTLAPDIITKDLNTNALFSLRSHKGRYVLIDFWGSWCAPCMRLLPEVKRLYEDYSSKIDFVSVAWDKQSDQKKLEKLIADNGMKWVQLLDDKDLKDGIVNKYKVGEFPTSILIDPQGKVIYRGSAAEGLRGLAKFFNSLDQSASRSSANETIGKVYNVSMKSN